MEKFQNSTEGSDSGGMDKDYNDHSVTKGTRISGRNGKLVLVSDKKTLRTEGSDVCSIKTSSYRFN